MLVSFYKFKYTHKLLDSFSNSIIFKEGVELIYVFDGKPPKRRIYFASRKQNKSIK